MFAAAATAPGTAAVAAAIEAGLSPPPTAVLVVVGGPVVPGRATVAPADALERGGLAALGTKALFSTRD